MGKYDVDGSGSIDFDEFLLMIKGLLQEARELDGLGTADNSAWDQLNQHAADRQQRSDALRAQEQEATGDAGNDGAQNGEQSPEKEQGADKKAQNEDAEVSCCCLRRDNALRKLSAKLAFNPYFESFILVCIFMSTVCLAIEREAWGGSAGKITPVRNALLQVDIFLNIAFLVECVSKVIAMGFFCFIKSGWNKLDFLIVATSTLDMGLPIIIALAAGGEGGADLGALRIFRIFRIFRALRPLRVIAKAKGLQTLVKTFVSSVGPASNTFAIAMGVWIIFGIAGMQLFSGNFYRCSDATVQYRFPGPVLSIYDDPLNSWDPGCQGVDDNGNERAWNNYDLSYDDILLGVKSMFLLTTMDNWPGHMVEFMDSRSKTAIPVYDSYWGTVWAAFFFLFFAIMVCGSVVINMVVGTFVDCYNMNVSAVGRSEPDPIHKMVKPLYVDPVAGLKGHVWRVISTTNFDMFIAFFLVANVGAMAVESWKKSSGQSEFDLVANYFFTYVFGMECLLKFYTLRMKRFFDSG